MRRWPWLVAAAGLCACALGPQPVTVGNNVAWPNTRADLEAERQAQIEMRAIQDRIDRGDLPKIEFEFDKDVITPQSYATLDEIAAFLRSDDRLKVLIGGHCDEIGSIAYNQDLSERRAKAVKTYLAKKGVPPPSMRCRGYGKLRPIADNRTPEGRAKNRRVEFHVTTRDWNAVYY